jgi:hypothetical protein
LALTGSLCKCLRNRDRMAEDIPGNCVERMSSDFY